MKCFSKKYDHPGNAKENFLAVLTYPQADMNCPFISGASLRVPLPHADPKEADGTDQEAVIYDQRCKQIETEIFLIMSEVVI